MADGISRGQHVIMQIISENSDRIKELKRNCRHLEKAQEELQAAVGKESAELQDKKYSFIEEQHRNEKNLAEKEAALSLLRELLYESLEQAKTARLEMQGKIDEITKAIETARQNKTDTETELAEINAAIRELKELLDKTKAGEP